MPQTTATAPRIQISASMNRPAQPRLAVPKSDQLIVTLAAA
jgi:hypothetical protein